MAGEPHLTTKGTPAKNSRYEPFIGGKVAVLYLWLCDKHRAEENDDKESDRAKEEDSTGKSEKSGRRAEERG